MEIIKNNTEQSSQPRGIGIDELRYRRALSLARYEMAKMRFVEDIQTAKNNIPSAITGKGLMGKILGSLNYMDYALIAYRIISKIRKFRNRNRQ